MFSIADSVLAHRNVLVHQYRTSSKYLSFSYLFEKYFSLFTEETMWILIRAKGIFLMFFNNFYPDMDVRILIWRCGITALSCYNDLVFCH